MVRYLTLVRHVGIIAILAMAFASPNEATQFECSPECPETLDHECVDWCEAGSSAPGRAFRTNVWDVRGRRNAQS